LEEEDSYGVKGRRGKIGRGREEEEESSNDE